MIFDVSLKFLNINKKLDKILLNLYGYSFQKNNKIIRDLGLNKLKNNYYNLNYLGALKVKKVIKRLSLEKIEQKLQNENYLIFRNIKSLKTYKSLRLKLFLPVRGQRTKTNAQTQKRKKLKNNMIINKDKKKLNIKKQHKK